MLVPDLLIPSCFRKVKVEKIVEPRHLLKVLALLLNEGHGSVTPSWP